MLSLKVGFVAANFVKRAAAVGHYGKLHIMAVHCRS